MQITSLLYIETADRPGLLVEIIKIIADVNIDVESAEIDTEVLAFLSLSYTHTQWRTCTHFAETNFDTLNQ